MREQDWGKEGAQDNSGLGERTEAVREQSQCSRGGCERAGLVEKGGGENDPI